MEVVDKEVGLEVEEVQEEVEVQSRVKMGFVRDASNLVILLSSVLLRRNQIDRFLLHNFSVEVNTIA